MFRLVECKCSSCFEERECVYCPNCETKKELYCKECIIGYNKNNGMIGVCPSCKTPYGKQNCYYIYGSDILPVLNKQLDKYRKRILSSPDYEKIRLCGYIRKLYDEGHSKHASLLQLYLNRLYKDSHPKVSSLLTWYKGIHECPIIMGLFEEFSTIVNNTINLPEYQDLKYPIIDINNKYDHRKTVISSKFFYYHHETNNVYYRKIDRSKPRSQILHSYTHVDEQKGLKRVKLTEKPFPIGDFLRGILTAAIMSDEPITWDKNTVSRSDSIEDFTEQYDILEEDDLLILGKRIEPDSTIEINGEEYVAFTLRFKHQRLAEDPTIETLSTALITRDLDTELQYNESIANTIIKEVHDRFKLPYSDDCISSLDHQLLNSATSVKNYIKRIASDHGARTKVRRTIDMLIETIKGDDFDTYEFMTLLDSYYLNAHPNNWKADLSPVIEEIRKQLFGDIKIASDLDKTLKPLISLTKPWTGKIGKLSCCDSTRPINPLTLNAYAILEKRETHNRISITKCVCGGSVMAKDQSGVKSVYKCTRCHKEYNTLPEQEMDPESLKMLEGDSKKCPRCSTYIQKTAGCNHMFCTNCHKSFNWDDLSDLSGEENTNPLYHEFRHGNGSNFRTLLDDYEYATSREAFPIGWFGHILYKDMRAAEDRQKELKESLSGIIDKFMTDDLWALKYLNELNINKLTIAFIQRSFDTMIEKAFAITDGPSGRRSTSRKALTKSLIDDSYSEYIDNNRDLTTLTELIEWQIESFCRLADHP